MNIDVPLHKHVYQIFFRDETTNKTSIRVIAFDETDALTIAKRQRPKAIITETIKIAD